MFWTERYDSGVCCWKENKTSKKTIILTNETKKKCRLFWLALRATSWKLAFSRLGTHRASRVNGRNQSFKQKGDHKGAQLKYLTNKRSKGPDHLDLRLYNPGRIFSKGLHFESNVIWAQILRGFIKSNLWWKFQPSYEEPKNLSGLYNQILPSLKKSIL